MAAMLGSSPSPPRASVLASSIAVDLADYCLRAIGPSRVLLIGGELLHMVSPLLTAGCEVSQFEALTSGVASTDMVIAWAATAGEFSMLLALDAATMMVIGPEGAGADFGVWVEEAAVLGWYLHPAVFALSGAPEQVAIRMLARAGVSLTDAWALPRANFHGLASALVRAGDAVLAVDAAQGDLWRIVLQHSRCSWLGVIGDRPQPEAGPGVEWLDRAQWELLHGSIDVVVTELRHDSVGLSKDIHAAYAALVRSGRLVVVVPLDSGRNPLQRELLGILEQVGLVIDRAWWQSLSRRMGPEQFIEVPRDSAGDLEIDSDRIAMADALVLMAVKVDGPGIAQDRTLKAPNLIAFQRDYLDASVVRLIVAVGLRLESIGHRRVMARKVMRDAPADSADYGAALCVLLYDPVALEGGGRAELLTAARRYMDAPAANPTVLRWQVSLAFASASLFQTSGDLLQAADLYNKVLALDVLDFSPLLGTKTTTAASRLGWIHFGRGELAPARQAWARGLDEARRLASQPDWSSVVGDPDAPEVFAMPEFAAVMDEAGSLASALRLTGEVPLRPGLAWQWANRSWRQQLLQAHAELIRQRTWQDNLQEAKNWLDGQYHQLNAELSRRDQIIQALESTVRTQTMDYDGLRAAYRMAHRHSVAEKATLSQQLHIMQADYERLSADHQRLIDASQQLTGAAQQLSTAAGVIMTGELRNRLPAESIAEEMTRLAAALNRMPLKRLVRVALRMLSTVLGRK